MTSGRLPSVLALAATIIAVSAAPAAASATPVKTLELGSTLTVSGQTGSRPGESLRAVGAVVVSGRWGHGPWRVLKKTRTDATGHYRFTITPRQRGVLTLRIAPPDRHDQHFVLHVI